MAVRESGGTRSLVKDASGREGASPKAITTWPRDFGDHRLSATGYSSRDRANSWGGSGWSDANTSGAWVGRERRPRGGGGASNDLSDYGRIS